MGSGSGSDDGRPGAADSGARRPREGAGESTAERSSSSTRGRPMRAVPSARASGEGSEGAKTGTSQAGNTAETSGRRPSRRPVQRLSQRNGSRRPGGRLFGGKAAAGRRFDGLRKRPRFRLTRRAGILALALCTVMVTVAYPLQEYLAQRSKIAAQNAQNAQTAQQIAQLKQQLAQWSDPNYVEIQARERLHYVMPGDIGFIVPSTAGSTEPLGMPSPSAQPWYDNLWSTLKSPSPSASPSPSP